MAIAPEKINALKAFFSSVEIPQSIQINSATVQRNAPQQIQEKLAGLESGQLSDITARTWYDHLL